LGASKEIAMKAWMLPLAFVALTPALAEESHVVVQKGRHFRPAEVTINRGESLTFTNSDPFIHQIYVPGLFDSEEKSPGENLTESFPKSGTFTVRCHIHPKMKLVVHVRQGKS
jgi:plastocyanin